MKKETIQELGLDKVQGNQLTVLLEMSLPSRGVSVGRKDEAEVFGASDILRAEGVKCVSSGE